MIEFLPVVIIVGLFWFPIYWILGGVFFAAVTFMRSIKLRRVRFSTYFSILSLIVAFGAAFGGMQLSYENGTTCTVPGAGFTETLSGVIGCGILEFVGIGFVGFIVLLFLGSLLMVLSKAQNQSWVDSDMGIDEEVEITFENM